MEEKQIQQKAINLVQKSGTYNYKLVIPAEVEDKIRFTCQRVWNTEWSGTLFFTHEGSFENNDLVIKCVDIYIMDIGNATYTEFDMNPDVIAYMVDHPELLDCQMGLIHSHAGMQTFFSGTDQQTLKEEGKDRNNFISLIVNNAGTYTAAITRRIKTKQVRESVSYEFFGDGEKFDTKDYVSNAEEIEWFYLKIEKEGKYSFPDMDARFEEIRKQKKEKEKIAEKDKKVIYTKYPDLVNSQPVKVGPANINKDKTKKEPVQETFFGDIDDNDLSYEEVPDIPYGQISIDSDTIKSLVRQLITCSIFIHNKVDIIKWVKNMPTLYENRFGKGDEGIEKFREWADQYTEFLTWNIEDEDLAALGYDQYEIQSICAYDLIEALSTLPENDYIKIYIDELEKYIIV